MRTHMPDSKAAARRRRIQAVLATRGRLRVADLAEALHVSPMTIRRDLEAMETDGLALRTHGGCLLRSALVTEAAFPEKENRHREQKHAIAAEAVQRLSDGMSLYLDTGTTCLQIARRLPSDRHLKVFTNNLRAAIELLGRPGIEVLVYGGRLAGKNPDLTGEYAIAQITRYRLDFAFFGADALDVETGEFYGADMATALMAQAIRRQAGRAAAVVDSSKLGKRSVAVAGHLEAGMLLITDDGVPPAVRRMLRRTGAEIVFATNHHDLSDPGEERCLKT